MNQSIPILLNLTKKFLLFPFINTKVQQAGLSADDLIAINGYKNYTTLETGNINIIISVPHNGNLKPTNIPDRVDANVANDLNTRRLANVLRSELQRLFWVENGLTATPFLIANNLHR